MNSKNAQAHLEIIISFLIFISFVIFLFTVFPVYKPAKSELGLDSSERGIMEKVSAETDSFSVIINTTLVGNCFCFKNNTEVKNVVARNTTGSVVAARYDSGAAQLCINGRSDVHTVYSGDNFEDGAFSTANCDVLGEGEALLGVTENAKVVSYKKSLKLLNTYSSDYNSLLANFSMPKGENFGFALTDLKGNYILRTSKSIPERVEVLARDTPVEISFENGTFIFGMLNTQSW